MEQPARKDVWANGAAYELYIGRWSRRVAQEFLAWLAVPPGARWLDVGCGTGALSQTILAQADPAAVQGVDASAAFVAYAQAHTPDPRASFAVEDAQALTAADGAFDTAVSGLVLNFIPQPERAAAAMARVTRPGGTVAAYVWDYAGQMQLMRYFWDVAVVLAPVDAGPLAERTRFPLCQPDPLAALWQRAGLQDVEVRAID